MSADNFHKGVEKEVKEMNSVYDYHDFRRCVSVAGDVTLMSDFFNFEKGLSQGTESKSSRPLFRSSFEKGRRSYSSNTIILMPNTSNVLF